MFAKLFDRPVYGQVLAKIDMSEDGSPELRWYVQPPGIGVCSFAMVFEDTDEGWDEAERVFNAADESKADAAGRALYSVSGLPSAS